MKLIFVYNSDAGFFSTAADIANKIFSPHTYSCKLCSLTHGYFKIKNDWVKFLEESNIESEFLHRDEFIKRYGSNHTEFPVILSEINGKREIFLDSKKIKKLKSLKDLIDTLKKIIPDGF